MGCQSEVAIGDNLTFTVCTHDPTTGILTDADAVPAYRVYEDETAATILTGNMAKLDDPGTTGFYSEQIACTAGNGFEDGKSYSIYITAAVGGDTGGISYGFRAMTQTTARVIPDAYAADGAQPTIEQAILMILQFLSERNVAGTTLTVRKPNGVTSAMTFTLNNAATPTDITRTT